ncbi:hypothetical protein [Paenibacillus massiliensis]|uniref:hypothetical protein n=1 Tax=Paenibacillus massiliensis TaxID=225917 RepID=UPI0004704AED|nr:hypothetical protein [Paenibacillus massiliensis]
MMIRWRISLFVLLSVVLTLSFPAPFTAQHNETQELVEATDISRNEQRETHQRPVVRTPSHTVSIIKNISQASPLFIIMTWLCLITIPRPYLPFIPIISIRKKLDFLQPIKYTSKFVAAIA